MKSLQSYVGTHWKGFSQRSSVSRHYFCFPKFLPKNVLKCSIFISMAWKLENVQADVKLKQLPVPETGRYKTNRFAWIWAAVCPPSWRQPLMMPYFDSLSHRWFICLPSFSVWILCSLLWARIISVQYSSSSKPWQFFFSSLMPCCFCCLTMELLDASSFRGPPSSSISMLLFVAIRQRRLIFTVPTCNGICIFCTAKFIRSFSTLQKWFTLL